MHSLGRLWCRIPVGSAKLLGPRSALLSWTRWTKESFGSHRISGHNTACVFSVASAPRMGLDHCVLAIQRPRLCRGLREPLHVTLSGGTLQLLHSATLSPNSAPLRSRCQKAPARIEKAQCMPARVTQRTEDARRAADSSSQAAAPGSVTCAPWRTP